MQAAWLLFDIVVIVTWLQGVLIEDITGVPGYPLAKCATSPTVKQEFATTTKPFGGGLFYFLIPPDNAPNMVFGEDVIRSYALHYIAKSQILCIIGRQMNIVYVTDPTTLVRSDWLGLLS